MKERTEKPIFKCVFCGKVKEGYGNSCWPIYDDEKKRCCDNCNRYVVIPKRFELKNNSK